MLSYKRLSLFFAIILIESVVMLVLAIASLYSFFKLNFIKLLIPLLLIRSSLMYRLFRELSDIVLRLLRKLFPKLQSQSINFLKYHLTFSNYIKNYKLSLLFQIV